MSDKQKQRVHKVILLGDARVGKTSIRKRYMGEGFKYETKLTMGADFSYKEVEGAHLQIWDLAGTHVFSKIRGMYYKGTHGAIIIFDLTQQQTFDNLDEWMKELSENTSTNIPIVIVGNKADLLDDANFLEDQMLQESLDKFRNKTGMSVPYFQTSALSGLNIDNLFAKILDEIDVNNGN